MIDVYLDGMDTLCVDVNDDNRLLVYGGNIADITKNSVAMQYHYVKVAWNNLSRDDIEFVDSDIDEAIAGNFVKIGSDVVYYVMMHFQFDERINMVLINVDDGTLAIKQVHKWSGYVNSLIKIAVNMSI